MGVHDVIVECERFSLDITDRCPHETCQNTTEFRSRSGTMNSTVGTAAAANGESCSKSLGKHYKKDASLLEPSYHQQTVRTLGSLQMSGNDSSFFSPSQLYNVGTQSTSESTGVTHRPIQGLITRSNYAGSQEGSPPEAAIEATPETTPVRVSYSIFFNFFWVEFMCLVSLIGL